MAQLSESQLQYQTRRPQYQIQSPQNKKLQGNFFTHYSSTHYSSKKWVIGKWRHLLEASCKLIGSVTALAQAAPVATVPAAAVPIAA